MRLFNLSEQVSQELEQLNEKSEWNFRIRLKDIFYNFQNQKIDLKHAKAQIASRIISFVKKEELDDKTENALRDIVKNVKAEGDAMKIDDLINSLFNVADANAILVK